MASTARIAIIENEQDVRELICALVEDQGHAVEAFPSGRDFAAAFKPGVFHLILTDLVMPEMDGYELLNHLKAQDPAVPVIAVTAGAYKSDREKAHAAGFSEFVTKPLIDLPTFFGLIAKHLGKTQ